MIEPGSGDVAVALSPHLDDAVFSLGSTLARLSKEGRSVHMVTVFAGPPAPAAPLHSLAKQLHELWGLGDDPVGERRQEDLEAAAVLGAQATHWDFIEALYRTGSVERPLYPDLSSLRQAPHRADAQLVENLSVALERLASDLDEEAHFFAPLAIGAHVDHVLLRAAAERTLPPSRLWLFEDLPYAFNRRVRKRGLPRRRTSEDVLLPISARDLERKCEAACCYRSQIAPAWPDRAALEREFRDFAAKSGGGERVWTVPTPSSRS